MVNIGIYRITCIVNGRVYFGSSINLKQRLLHHRNQLVKGTHANQKLQNDWNFYGPASFEFKVIIRHQLPRHKLLALENLFIHSHWDGQVGCYNVMQDARSPRGRRHTDETRAKIAKAAMGNTKGVGHKVSEEEKSNLSRRAMGNTRAFGRIVSEETRAKIGEKNWGRKVSVETRIKCAEASRGHVKSDETRAKLSKAHKGRAKSEEHKLALKKAWVLRKLRVAGGSGA